MPANAASARVTTSISLPNLSAQPSAMPPCEEGAHVQAMRSLSGMEEHLKS